MAIDHRSHGRIPATQHWIEAEFGGYVEPRRDRISRRSIRHCRATMSAVQRKWNERRSAEPPTVTEIARAGDLPTPVGRSSIGSGYRVRDRPVARPRYFRASRRCKV